MNAVLRSAAAFTLSLACSGCSGSQSAMLPAGHSAVELRWLILFIVIICAVVWAAVMAVLIAALVRPRRPDRPDVVLEHGGERRMTAVVAGSVAATIVIITVFTLTSFWTTRALHLDERDALVINVRGYQWWWEVTYPGSNGSPPLTTANEIHIPVGRTIKVNLAAADVIHSFWVPSLAGKQDLIPGRDNSITFEADRPGLYRGQCAEFCGFQHAHMAMLVVAEDAEAFKRWQTSQLKNFAAPASDEERHGHDVFVTKACAVCHTVRGTTAGGKLGPDLTHVASRQTIAAGLFETTRGSLAAWTADPQGLKPGNNMPMVALSADELKAVSAFMAALK